MIIHKWKKHKRTELPQSGDPCKIAPRGVDQENGEESPRTPWEDLYSDLKAAGHQENNW